jgi:alpha-L-fucosidase 2
MNIASKTATRAAALMLFGLAVVHAEAQAPALFVRFNAPARAFGEAMPTGNGRLGAMMYGGISHERLSLNENSMWSGSPHNSDRSDAAKQLPEIRRLLLAGDNAAAEALVNKSFTSADKGSDDPRYGSYQELGQALLDFDGIDDAGASNYHRALDLDGAIARTSFDANGVTYTRSVFTSAPDQAIIVHLTASRARALSFTVALTRVERFHTIADGNDALVMTGELDSGDPTVPGLKYASRLRVIAHGGTTHSEGDKLHIRNADDVTLLITAATNYMGFAGRRTADQDASALADIRTASAHTYTDLLTRHQADFRRYFRRVALDLGPHNPAIEDQPTADRFAAAHSGASDPSLAELYFQYGRYLLISSSRPGGLPPNLQGLWGEGKWSPWNGDWHLNVNIQMNFWPAEITGLGDLTGPLFALTNSLQTPGARTARAYYNADGWVAHIMTNPWGFTSPGQDAAWGSTIIGSAWLLQHVWAHYLYTGDKQFLRSMYPAMKGAAEFYLSMLVTEPKHGWLVTAPSNSPENSFYLPNGQKASVAMGPAIDEEILRYFFNETAETEKILGVDPALRAKLIDARAKLAPIQVGDDGRILEWLEPYREVDPHHRHVSHLWAAYPGDEISPYTTPQLAAATRKSLEVRGDGATGWSLAYKMILWARLGDGDHAYTLLRNLWNPVDAVKQNATGSLPNLFDVCPPFQIDGNFGAATAIAEMLMDSRPGELHILPALPSSLPEGEVRGLRAMGGITANIAWKNHTLTTLHLHADRDAAFTLTSGENTRTLQMKAGQQLTLDASLQPTH